MFWLFIWAAVIWYGGICFVQGHPLAGLAAIAAAVVILFVAMGKGRSK